MIRLQPAILNYSRALAKQVAMAKDIRVNIVAIAGVRLDSTAGQDFGGQTPQDGITVQFVDETYADGAGNPASDAPVCLSGKSKVELRLRNPVRCTVNAGAATFG